MRISAWSSDVCSSDLTDGTFASGFIPDVNIDGALWTHTAPAGKFIADIQFFAGMNPDGSAQDLPPGKIDLVSVGVQSTSLDVDLDFTVTLPDRSEKRRVGKEGVSTCESRGWPD